MKKWYQENYVSRRNWILANIRELGLNPAQTLTVLLIDYDNEFRESISVEILAQQGNMTAEETDRIITELCQLGYLKITSRSRHIYYDLSGLFEDKPKVEVSGDIFALFEGEFGRPLSQKETTMIASWMNQYPQKTVVNGLREAVKYGKLSVDYIDRILVNGRRNEK